MVDDITAALYNTLRFALVLANIGKTEYAFSKSLSSKFERSRGRKWGRRGVTPLLKRRYATLRRYASVTRGSKNAKETTIRMPKNNPTATKGRKKKVSIF